MSEETKPTSTERVENLFDSVDDLIKTIAPVAEAITQALKLTENEFNN
jgi:hypothetical protein